MRVSLDLPLLIVNTVVDGFVRGLDKEQLSIVSAKEYQFGYSIPG